MSYCFFCHRNLTNLSIDVHNCVFSGARRIAGSQTAVDPAETWAAGSGGGSKGCSQAGAEGAPDHQGQQEWEGGAAPSPNQGRSGSAGRLPNPKKYSIRRFPSYSFLWHGQFFHQKAAEKKRWQEQVKRGEEAEAKMGLQVTALNENVATLKREWQGSQRRVGELEKQTDELRGEIAVLEATVQNNQDERRALLERWIDITSLWPLTLCLAEML